MPAVEAIEIKRGAHVQLRCVRVPERYVLKLSKVFDFSLGVASDISFFDHFFFALSFAMASKADFDFSSTAFIKVNDRWNQCNAFFRDFTH